MQVRYSRTVRGHHGCLCCQAGVDSDIDTGIRHERSISPGQLADGTHVATSGAKGQSYEPGSGKMGKLKNKFHIGQH